MAKIANFGKKMPEKLSFLPENGVCTQILFVELAEATFVDLALKIECWSSRRGKRHSPSLESEAAPQGLAEYHV